MARELIGDDFFRSIRPGRLRDLLRDLPEDALLTVNEVGNLLILSPTREPLGYLDIGDEEVHLFDHAP